MWATFEVAGAIGNIVANTTESTNPKLKAALEYYNLAMGIVGVYHTAKGLANFSKYVAKEVKENKSIRNAILAFYINYKTALKEAKLTDEEQQLVTNQEKVWKAVSDERFVAKSGAELKTYLNSLKNYPMGVSYEGNWYRYTSDPSYNPIEIYSKMVDAENRFRKGLYLSETKPGNTIEANSYGGTSNKTLYEITKVKISNLLDLTDANTVEALGTNFEQMKLTGVTNAYEYTQEVAIWAKSNGYSGIKFYGAQGGTIKYTTFVIFDQSSVNNSIKGSVKDIPW